MKLPRFRFSTVLLCALLGCSGVRADLASDIQSIVDAEMAANHVTGAVVGVWRGGEEVTVFARGYADVASGIPLTVADHFRIASITKTFTTTRVLQLSDAGLLSLDDPIGSYVPGLSNGSATLRQLGNMTAGFADYSRDPDFIATVTAAPLRVWSPSELVARAEAMGPSFAPGTAWEYSNTHTVLLQMVIEQVTGRSLSQEFQTAFSTPLSMTQTSYPATADLPDPFARGYLVDSATGGQSLVEVGHPSIFGGAGGIVSTLEDVRVWIEAVGRGDLVSAQSQSERLDMVPLVEGFGYGFGVMDAEGWIGHNGSYPPGYQTIALYDPGYPCQFVLHRRLPLSGRSGFADQTAARAGTLHLRVARPGGRWIGSARPSPPLQISRARVFREAPARQRCGCFVLAGG